MRGEWLTFRELSLVTNIGWNKLRYLRDSGVLTDLGMILYQKPCHKHSRWWIWVPSVFCHSQLLSPTQQVDYPPRDVPKT
jgi:hypothetical protein